MPVRVSDTVSAERDKPAKKETCVVAPGAIVIEFSNACVRIEGAADPASIRAALDSCAGDLVNGKHQHLDHSSGDLHAPRLHRIKRGGANGAGTESILRTCVRLSRQTRRSDQTALVRWRWTVLVRQTPGIAMAV